MGRSLKQRRRPRWRRRSGDGSQAASPAPIGALPHRRSIWGLGNSGGTMRITVNVEIGPEEVPMATELLAVLR